MDQDVSQAIFFYSRHPISADIILTKLRASRVTLWACGRRSCFRTTRTTTAG